LGVGVGGGGGGRLLQLLTFQFPTVSIRDINFRDRTGYIVMTMRKCHIDLHLNILGELSLCYVHPRVYIYERAAHPSSLSAT
jgi:hypothetical protein